ncbi:right-handed parallel beta-helix repeat-containing protein [Haloarcula nitratireducens]|uniref:Right-handed parallel beta-helix repeat-containing protein n=1 Tax=Haloarcula nitratireducens TaxID=2487749 RepID=A0AAW4P6L3_9EURY|nr:right-handed parallel beta-helix repeat-containing protein [Halomicroarcula nitratireducens]MBX0293392.1 right-handed parallel beta-helix repeat-containing protein [Halomicroarcula nitratireducens]
MNAVRTHASLFLLSALIVTGTAALGLLPIGAAQTVGDGTFVVESTSEAKSFDYAFTVEGSVSKTQADGYAAEASDRIVRNDDGTVTVTGTAGDQWGDAYEVEGRIVAFEKTSGTSTFRLELDGEDVTGLLTGRRGDTAESAEPIDACTTITEPGRYELTTDLQDSGVETCIHVRSDDVVIDGDGHVVDGVGRNGTVGVRVFNGTDGERVGPELANVTVTDVRVRDWERGVVAGEIFRGGPTLRVSDLDARDNAGGLLLYDVEDSTVENVTLAENGDGLRTWETTNLTVRSLNASANADVGVRVGQASSNVTLSDLRAASNGGRGVVVGTTGVSRVTIRDADVRNNGGVGLDFRFDVFDHTVSETVVAGNGGDGVRLVDASDVRIQDTVVRDNAGDGIRTTRSTGTLGNVTLRNNAGAAYNDTARDGDGFDADRLSLSGVTVSFTGEPTLAAATSVPTLPDGYRRTGEALRAVSALPSDDLSATFSAPARSDGERAELWYHDGETWTRVEGATAGSENATVSIAGNGTLALLEPSGPSGDATPATERLTT